MGSYLDSSILIDIKTKGVRILTGRLSSCMLLKPGIINL